MPATERENVLQGIASVVASRYLTAATTRFAAWNMDMLARLSILEGAAGVSPGSWVSQRERGFGSALEHFGPKLAASWTSSTSQGVYDKAISAAARVLRNVSGTDAVDLIQDMMSGSSTSSGPARTRVFYSVGNALRKDEGSMFDGSMTPSNRRVMGTLERWVSRAALDVVKTLKEQKQKHKTGPEDPREPDFAEKGLDDEERSNLLLLALQSPGGPGKEVRRIIDHEIDRSFRKETQPVVRAFLEKMGHPKYRSPSEMKRMLARFNPKKWFTQAYNLIRKEIMEEQGISPQQLTNALGSNASKVFLFMREKVGKNPRVQKIIEELADTIELHEPGVSHMANERKLAHAVVRRWLKDKEREANLSSGNALAMDGFEMNEYKNWDEQATSQAEYRRGPSPLRVASRWMGTDRI